MSALGTNDVIPEADYFASLNDGSPHAGFAATFAGLNTAGVWEINISDVGGGGDGQLEFVTLNFTSTAVPEPSTIVLLSLCGGLCLLRRRK